MLQTIFNHWHFMRVLRLLLSIIIIVEGFAMNDTMLLIMGFVFMILAIFNVGCCGNNCTIPKNDIHSTKENKITYEEIK